MGRRLRPWPSSGSLCCMGSGPAAVCTASGAPGEVDSEGSVESSVARAHLLAAVAAFVHAARDLDGITGIALLGSLVTAKPDPKDADLLVAAADDLDLTALAALARRLQGRAQQRNAGADVFLATPRGSYLGRICPWRECRPGLRLRCDALHCGRRPYLHDDLGAIRLPAALLAAPPIELWPRVAARVPVPADVEATLLAPLRRVARV